MSEHPWYIRQVSSDLYVELFSGDDPHLTINREGGGLVRVELAEVRVLAEELPRGAALLAAHEAQEHYDSGERHSDVW